MILSRDKSVKLAQLYSKVGWLEQYSASQGLRLNEASTQASKMEAQARGLELELTSANGERDAQRAAAEQKAKEAELQVATLRENVVALVARAAWPSKHLLIPSCRRMLSSGHRGMPSAAQRLPSKKGGPLCRRSCNRSTLHGRSWMLALLKYPFYPLFNFDNGMNLISKSLTILTSARLLVVFAFAHIFWRYFVFAGF